MDSFQSILRISFKWTSNLQQIMKKIKIICTKKVKDVIQTKVQLSPSQKQKELQLVQSPIKEIEKLIINNKRGIIRRIVQFNQIVLPPNLRDLLLYQELNETKGHLGGEQVCWLAKEMINCPCVEQDIKYFMKNSCICFAQRKPMCCHKLPFEQ